MQTIHTCENPQPFIQIPKCLIGKISAEAVLLYGLMLDRHHLSEKNGWKDLEGTYINFSVTEVMDTFHVSKTKAAGMIQELSSFKLENGLSLIKKTRVGLGKMNRIYVTDIIGRISTQEENGKEASPMETKTAAEASPADGIPKRAKPERPVRIESTEENQEFQNSESRSPKNRLQEVQKSDSNNNYYNNIYFSRNNNNNNHNNRFIYNNRNNIISYQSYRKEKIRLDMNTYMSYKELIKENIDYEVLLSRDNGAWTKEKIDELLNVAVEAVCSSREYQRVNGEDVPTELVKRKLLKLNYSHMEYVLRSLHSTRTDIRSIRQYMLTCLFNAPTTINNYYAAMVQHDMYENSVG